MMHMIKGTVNFDSCVLSFLGFILAPEEAVQRRTIVQFCRTMSRKIRKLKSSTHNIYI